MCDDMIAIHNTTNVFALHLLKNLALVVVDVLFLCVGLFMGLTL